MSAAPSSVDGGLPGSSALWAPSSALTFKRHPLTHCISDTPAPARSDHMLSSTAPSAALLPRSWLREAVSAVTVPLADRIRFLPSSSSPFLFHSRYEVHSVRCRKSTALGRLAPVPSDPGASPRRSEAAARPLRLRALGESQLQAEPGASCCGGRGVGSPHL